jgi:hypothetical protein
MEAHVETQRFARLNKQNPIFAQQKHATSFHSLHNLTPARWTKGHVANERAEARVQARQALIRVETPVYAIDKPTSLSANEVLTLLDRQSGKHDTGSALTDESTQWAKLRPVHSTGARSLAGRAACPDFLMRFLTGRLLQKSLPLEVHAARFSPF